MSKVWYEHRRELAGLFLKSKTRSSLGYVGLSGIFCGSYWNWELLLHSTSHHSFQVCAQRVKDKMNYFPEFKSEKFYTTETPPTNTNVIDDGLSTYLCLNF